MPIAHQYWYQHWPKAHVLLSESKLLVNFDIGRTLISNLTKNFMVNLLHINPAK